MPIRVTCACGKKYAFKDEFAGRRAKCQACGTEIMIPGQPTAATPVVAKPQAPTAEPDENRPHTAPPMSEPPCCVNTARPRRHVLALLLAVVSGITLLSGGVLLFFMNPSPNQSLLREIKQALPPADGPGIPLSSTSDGKFDIRVDHWPPRRDAFLLKGTVPARCCLGKWELVAEFAPSEDGSGAMRGCGIVAVVGGKSTAMWAYDIDSTRVKKHFYPEWYTEVDIHMSGTRIYFQTEVYECYKGEVGLDGKAFPVMCLQEVPPSGKQGPGRVQIWIPNGSKLPPFSAPNGWFSRPMDSSRMAPSN